MGSFASKVAVHAAAGAFSAAAGMAAPPLIIGLAAAAAAAAATGAAAGWSYEAIPTSEDSSGTTPSPWSTGFAAGNKAVRDAIDAMFEAITKAQEAASSYVYALSSAAAWIAAKAYDKVKLAAASVKRRVVALIKFLYSVESAAVAETKLDSVDGPIGARDASSLVECVVVRISGGPSSAIIPARSSGPLVVHALESAAAKLARSSADEMTSLLESIPSVQKKVGLKIPVVATAAIGVIAVAAGLCLAVCSPTMLAAASLAAAAFI
jgi:hypothetical protein